MMINAVIIFGFALAYALLKIYLEKRLGPLDDVGDDRHMADLAFACGCSVYDLFRLAGDQWNFSDGKMASDFRLYLKTNQIPPYVSNYVRHHRFKRNRTYQQLIYMGGRPPYL